MVVFVQEQSGGFPGENGTQGRVVIKRGEERLYANIQCQTNDFANDTWVFVATAETAFIIHLEVV